MKSKDPHSQFQVAATKHPSDSITGINRRHASIKRPSSLKGEVAA